MAMEPIVVEPKDFNQELAWAECRNFVESCGGLEHADGEPNWKAAFGADPGVVSCPHCHTMYWAWGQVQRCAECGFEYPVDWWTMFSWGAQAGRGGFMRQSRLHSDRLCHAYYKYGFENPPAGDLYAAARSIQWREVFPPNGGECIDG